MAASSKQTLLQSQINQLSVGVAKLPSKPVPHRNWSNLSKLSVNCAVVRVPDNCASDQLAEERARFGVLMSTTAHANLTE